MLKQYETAQYRFRKIVNVVMLGFAAASAAAAIVVLFLILGYVLQRGGSAIDFAFLTQTPKPLGDPGGGMANALIGSLIVLGIASAIALPVGFFAGTYLSEYAAGWLGNTVRFVTDTLAGIPSIVVGIFIYALIVRPMGTFSAVAGGAALALIMIPIFTRAAEEALRTVPFSLREAAMALGTPTWRVVLRVVVPSAASGVITAFMLALARAGGETAPLLFTALGNSFWSTDLTGPIDTLPTRIYTYAIGPYDDWHRQAWAGALLLVIMTVGIISVVRLAYRGARVDR
jgi:phosphate transport system permease protein